MFRTLEYNIRHTQLIRLFEKGFRHRIKLEINLITITLCGHIINEFRNTYFPNDQVTQIQNVNDQKVENDLNKFK